MQIKTMRQLMQARKDTLLLRFAHPAATGFANLLYGRASAGH
jgi:hypothetical protein